MPNLLQKTLQRLCVLALVFLAGLGIKAEDKLTPEQFSALVPHVLKIHLERPELDAMHMKRLLKKFMEEQLDISHTFYTKEEHDARLMVVPDTLPEAEKKAKQAEVDATLVGISAKLMKGDLSYFSDWVKEFKEKQLARDEKFFKELVNKKDQFTRKIPDEEVKKIKFDEYPASNEEREARLYMKANFDYHLYKEYLSEEESFTFAVQTMTKPREKWAKLDPAEDTPKLVMKAFMSSLDPHSEYMDSEDMEQFNSSMQRNFAGIGVRIRGCPLGAQVEEIIKGGPAAKNGKLERGDQIIAVDELVVAGLTLSDIVKKIKGEKGSDVKLRVKKAPKAGAVKDNEGEIKVDTISLTRDTIDLTEFRVTSKSFEGPGGTIGYVAVTNFYDDMARDVRQRIAQLKEKGPLAGLILDLRDNSGGLLKEAVDLTGLFISKGPVVGEKNNRQKVEWNEDTDPETQFDGPLVVMVNQFSASASEIVSGSLRDYNRAVIVGPSQTHGKGTVQRLVDLSTVNMPGMIKITFQQYYVAGGESVQLKGVVPDITVPGRKLFKEYLEAAYDGAIPEGKITPALKPDQPDLVMHTEIKNRILPLLKVNSEKRVAANKDFDRFRKDPKDLKPEDGADVPDPDAATENKNPQNEKNPETPEEKKKKLKDPQLDEAVAVVRDMVACWTKSTEEISKLREEAAKAPATAVQTKEQKTDAVK